MKWVALFSGTGKEIMRIAKELNRLPDTILTNNSNEVDWMSNLPLNKVTIMPSDAIHTGLRFTKEKQFVTLHGYMKIIPSDVCEMHEIFNGHPGIINLYPELKGKDPQEKAWDNRSNYEYVGSVVHRVTSELDGGEIVSYVYTDNDCQTKEELYNVLRDTSYEAWIDFLKGQYL
jgi:formyltetrahydrofolate hydrolase